MKFQTPEILEEKINEYFMVCDAGEDVEELTKKGDLVKYHRKIPYTVEGMALHLDCDPTTIREYQKRDGFSLIISRARDKIFNSWIRLGLSGQYNPKIISLCLAANYKPYNVTRQHEITAGTYSAGSQSVSNNPKY